MSLPNANLQDIDATLARMQAEGTRAVRVLFTDLHGVARGKDVPIREFRSIAEEGLAFCAAILTTDLRHTPVVGGESGYVDLVARPDLQTLRVVPWQPEVAWCIASLWRLDADEPWPSCPRGALQSAVDAYQELGLTPIVGPELEFFLLERDSSVPAGFRRYVDEFSRVYTVGYVSDPKGIALEMLHACDELRLGAFAANHEYMNSQYEINIRHSAAVDAADRAFFLKTAVKEIAARNGMLATFIGKPFNDQGGSGFHVHVSLSGEHGDNVFSDETGQDGLGTMATQFVAGVLAHAPALMAVLAPTVNAYKRIVPDSLAPTHANWGHDNRTAFVRVPLERGPRARVELRAGDGSANAHLMTAAILRAGIDGIERGLELQPPVAGDAYGLGDRGGDTLPSNLGEALDALEADETIKTGLGEALVRDFVALKRFELARFHRHVTDWELEEYVSHL